MMDVDEEEDAVVSEIPVYLCGELSKQLHLFQFPCRSSEHNTYTKNIVSSRVKPQSGIIELDCALDTDSPHYDFYVGEELGASINDGSKPNDNEDETKLLDRLTLRSERSILKKDKNCYSVAGVYDGKFCISPLEESHSFLPTHEHRENAKKASAKDVNSDAEMSDDDADGASAVAVTVKFTHKSQDKAKISQEQSHHQHLIKTAEEPWCETTFHNSTSNTAVTTMERLTKTTSCNRTARMTLNEEQYLNVLIPADTSDLINTSSR